MEADFNRIGKAAFDKCLHGALQTEMLRNFTQNCVNQARAFLEKLTDERIGRLFRSVDMVNVPSISGSEEYAFKLTAQDYNIKSEHFNAFLNELYQANLDFTNTIKLQQIKKRKNSISSAVLPLKPEENPLAALMDDKRIFACKKTDLSAAVFNAYIDSEFCR